jgi:hypothetical protein
MLAVNSRTALQQKTNQGKQTNPLLPVPFPAPNILLLSMHAYIIHRITCVLLVAILPPPDLVVAGPMALMLWLNLVI